MVSDSDRSPARRWLASVVSRPLWLCIALACVSYVLLHALAIRPRVIVTDPSQLGAALPGLMLAWVAESLEFLLPLACLFGIPLLRVAQRSLPSADPAPCGAHAGDAMSPYEFERLTSGGLRLRRRRLRAALPAAPEDGPGTGLLADGTRTGRLARS